MPRSEIGVEKRGIKFVGREAIQQLGPRLEADEGVLVLRQCHCPAHNANALDQSVKERTPFASRGTTSPNRLPAYGTLQAMSLGPPVSNGCPRITSHRPSAGISGSRTDWRTSGFPGAGPASYKLSGPLRHRGPAASRRSPSRSAAWRPVRRKVRGLGLSSARGGSRQGWKQQEASGPCANQMEFVVVVGKIPHPLHHPVYALEAQAPHFKLRPPRFGENPNVGPC